MREHLKQFGVGFVGGATLGLLRIRQWRGVLELLPALVTGIVAGSILAAISVMNRATRIEDVESGSSQEPVQVRTIRVAGSFDFVFAACQEALQAIPKLHVANVNQNVGTIEARVGLTWRSLGETITVHIPKTNFPELEVTFRSAPSVRSTLTDWGKSARNAAIFTKAFRERVVSNGRSANVICRI